MLTNIIDRHKRYFAEDAKTREPFVYDSLSFTIPTNGFNPAFGKISQPLLKQVLDREPRLAEAHVLDAGTGSGFYAVALYKRGAKKVVGTDITEEIIEAAKANAQANGASGVTFTKCSEENLFSECQTKDKFDIIIANLPFTNRRVVGKLPEPDFVSNFIGDEKGLFNFLTGCRKHLSETGRLYMSYGRTGFPRALEEDCKAAGLKRETLETIEGRDETFFIYKITHQ
ncbi:Uncharacterized protein MLTONO_p0552 (plasmid) [Mesorhizobium loti]|nr:Uncharacterized protein MLTONO_p0552 [Mesorhizobium loti]